jgi:uncharacterized protein YdeI (YjbR/CyaY-like superfamily)
MGKKNPATDDYIARAAPFARPILRKIRKAVHAGCPGVEEVIKWGAPHFEYKGPLGGMAAFKAHVGFGFWKEKLLLDGSQKAVGRLGCLRAVDDLPAEKVLLAVFRKAADLNERGVKIERTPVKKPPVRVPADFKAALAKEPKALAAFEAFSPSHRREYVDWVTEAKTEATRTRRLATAVEWMAQGKSRNWKYERA